MRYATLVFVLLVPALALLIPACAAAQSGPQANAENGKRLFLRDACWECHGTVGQGSRDGARIAATSLSLQGVIRYVRRPAGSMPAFSEKVVSDQDLTDIYAYLKSLPPAKPAKDVPLLNQAKNE
jgi:ubiquinol-cytochrome c reductase cytochrome c subunit